MAIKNVFHSATGAILAPWRQLGNAIDNVTNASREISVIKSGFSHLDRAIGIGGMPQGRLIELIGPDTGGMMAIAAKLAAKFQRKQLPVTILDAAGQFDAVLAARCGLAAPDLLIMRPRDGLELIHLVESSAQQAGLIVIYLGFVPNTFGAIPPAKLASLLKRLQWITNRSKSVFLYVTQLEDVDPFIHTNYVSGFPLNDIADVRLWVQDEGWMRKGDQVGGYRGNITVIKNMLSASGKGVNIRIPFIDPDIVRMEEEFGF